MSLDGYIDDATPDRLLLSNEEDFDRIDRIRAESDAILVGAGTIRADNPRLLVNSEQRRRERVARGGAEHPLKVTLSASGDLDPRARFWHYGGTKVAYTTDTGAKELEGRLDGLADVVSLGPTVDFGALLDDLGERGVRRLMVEGGSHIHTAFLGQGMVDEIQLAVAPVLVGDPRAPRFLGPAAYPAGRMALAETQAIGDMALLRYLPKEESTR